MAIEDNNYSPAYGFGQRLRSLLDNLYTGAGRPPAMYGGETGLDAGSTAIDIGRDVSRGLRGAEPIQPEEEFGTPSLPPPPAAPMLPPGQGVQAPNFVMRTEPDFLSAPPPPPTPAATTTKAEAPSSPIRAVRMPDGKIIFTNRSEYSTAPEVSRESAVAEVRSNDRPLTPTQIAMTEAIRNSQRSDLDKTAAIRANEHPGAGGSFSDLGDVAEGGRTDYNKELMTRGRLEELDRMVALARARNELDVASRSPEEQRALATKEIGIMDYMQAKPRAEIDAINKKADEALALLPNLTSDPVVQEQLRRKIEMDRNRDIETVMNVLAYGVGIRPNVTY